MPLRNKGNKRSVSLIAYKASLFAGYTWATEQIDSMYGNPTLGVLLTDTTKQSQFLDLYEQYINKVVLKRQNSMCSGPHPLVLNRERDTDAPILELLEEYRIDCSVCLGRIKRLIKKYGNENRVPHKIKFDTNYYLVVTYHKGMALKHVFKTMFPYVG